MEKWASVKGFEGRYEVSDQGRVRSVERETPNGKMFLGVPLTRRLKPRILPSYVRLLTRDGKLVNKRLDILVKDAFKPTTKAKLEQEKETYGTQA